MGVPLELVGLVGGGIGGGGWLWGLFGGVVVLSWRCCAIREPMGLEVLSVWKEVMILMQLSSSSSNSQESSAASWLAHRTR